MYIQKSGPVVWVFVGTLDWLQLNFHAFVAKTGGSNLAFVVVAAKVPRRPLSHRHWETASIHDALHSGFIKRSAMWQVVPGCSTYVVIQPNTRQRIVLVVQDDGVSHVNVRAERGSRSSDTIVPSILTIDEPVVVLTLNVGARPMVF